ncbi:MAG: EAL domain-containing protein, partial [Peptostreptococcales bacterium]
LVKDNPKELLELVMKDITDNISMMKSSFLENRIIGGIAFYPNDAINHYELLDCANMAKENAKNEGQAYELYDSKKLKKYNFYRDIFSCIQGDSYQEDISVAYNPILNLAQEKIGYEPVLLWKDASLENNRALEEKLRDMAEIQGKEWDITLYKIRKVIQEKLPLLSNSLIRLKVDIKDLLKKEPLHDLYDLDKDIIKNHKIILDLQGNVFRKNNSLVNKIIRRLKSIGFMTGITLKYTDLHKMEELRLLHVDILTLDITNLGLGKGNSFNENVVKMIRDHVMEQKKGLFIEGFSNQAEADFFTNNGFKIIGLSQLR